ncbi:MAG: hypothetical protein KDE22_16150 [Rhodobacterales bacterium]|nr:hypothetical protein [Rhodobacterales bacterium]
MTIRSAPIALAAGLMLAALVAALVAAAPQARAEQKGRSGQPLAVYCNTAPDFSVQRSDSVDNWVRICTVWLNAPNAATGRNAPAPVPTAASGQ